MRRNEAARASFLKLKSELSPVFASFGILGVATAHSSSLRCDISRRHVARRTASMVYVASYGRHNILKLACKTFCRAVCKTSEQCCLKWTSRGQRNPSIKMQSSAGRNTIPIRLAVHGKAFGKNTQPKRNYKSSANMLRLRRRLSNIFQRDKFDSGFFDI